MNRFFDQRGTDRLMTRQPSLTSIVQRRFLTCVNARGQSVPDVVNALQVAPSELCRLIAGQNIAHLNINTYYQIARWLHMPLANIMALASAKPRMIDLMRLGMQVRGFQPTSSQDQIAAAAQAGVSVAVFRRALHGYATFTPSIRTCDRLAEWLAWTGFHPDDIALATGMLVRYRHDGTRVALTPHVDRAIQSYPCACGRAGCLVPAHLPNGPRRKWRSDACRMWAKRKTEREALARAQKAARPARAGTPLPQRAPVVRFIRINERSVPVRF